MDFDFNKYGYKNKKYTGIEACELISQHWKDTNKWGENDERNYWTPEQIWYYSPSGELSGVFIWWDDALNYYYSNGKIIEKE